MLTELTFRAKLWIYNGHAAWHFVTLPAFAARKLVRSRRGMITAPAGFGSIKVRATIGDATWSTSIFPDKKSGSYVLPVKADVRSKAGLSAGDRALVRLEFPRPADVKSLPKIVSRF